MTKYSAFGLASFDLAVLSLAALVGAGTVALMYNPSAILNRLIHHNPSQQAIATISAQNKDVRRRFSDSLVWYDASKNLKLFDRDFIFVGEKSKAELQIENGSRITLDEQTLVQIVNDNGEISLDLQLGQFWIDIPTGKKVKVKKNGVWKRYEGKTQPQRLQVSKTAERGVIAKSLLGDAISEEELAGPVVNAVPAAPSVPAAVEPLKAEPAAPQIEEKPKVVVLKFATNVNPKAEASEIEKGILNPPQFDWKAEDSGADEFKIEIAEDSEFKKSILTTSTKGSEWIWKQARPGDYFWRVQPKVGEVAGPQSPIGKLKVKLPAPEIQKVEDQEILFDDIETLKDSPVEIKLGWGEVPLASQYRVQVSSDVNFKNLQFDKKLKNSEASFAVKEDGDYYARMASLSDNGKRLSDFSKAQKFSVQKLLNLKTPTAKSPLDGVTVVMFGGPQSSPVIFSWTKVSAAEGYDFEVADNKEFSNPILTKKPKESSLMLKTLSGGEYFWRVRARKDKYHSDWSTPNRISLKKQ